MLFDPNWKPAETEVQLENWQKILLAAADLIQKRGWCHGEYESDSGRRHCAVGAINKAAGFNHDLGSNDFYRSDYGPKAAWDDRDLAIKMLTTAVSGEFGYIEEWNDAKNTRTHRNHVLDTMRRVAQEPGYKVKRKH